MKVLIVLAIALIASTRCDDCSNYNEENICQHPMQTSYPIEYWSRIFQTPPRESDQWKPGFHDYSKIVGHARVKYQGNSVSITIYTFTNKKYFKDGDKYTTIYKFGTKETNENTITLTKAETLKYMDGMEVSATVFDQAGQRYAFLPLEEIDFIWNHPEVKPRYEQLKGGQKGVIVEMFGWNYEEVEKECPLIAKLGYLGVKVYSPNEHVIDFENTDDDQLNPWYWVYQPVSYKLQSRMGTRKQLRKMINTCRSLGVRVYAEAVLNHMAGDGYSSFARKRDKKYVFSSCNTWGPKGSTAGSPYFTTYGTYETNEFTGQKPGLEFPAIPFGPGDFHCSREIKYGTDYFFLNYGWIAGLPDVKTGDAWVQGRQADFLVDLIGIGFSGFRLDAAKLTHPKDHAKVFGRFREYLGGLPKDFLTYFEAIPDVMFEQMFCWETDYSFHQGLDRMLLEEGYTRDELVQIRFWIRNQEKHFQQCDNATRITGKRLTIGLDTHDHQFSYGGDIPIIGKDKNICRWRSTMEELLKTSAFDTDIKLVMSGFWSIDDCRGPPDGLSDCAMCATDVCKRNCKKSVPKVEAAREGACPYENPNSFGWTRTHRDILLVKAMREWLGMSTDITEEDFGLPETCKVKCYSAKMLVLGFLVAMGALLQLIL
eukprot:TRINITY_DN332_c0_g1_i1.p1 TRINITY_DN332_c0_g1~~TRINITY_DN332_c0_g1_i1.p1  ORF type:complete len:653 (+),score=103.06 TRINITY_DN332_c0_g1_i1:121-2079(+)